MKTLVAITLSFLCGIAQAESWSVDVTLGYVNSKINAVVDVPVLNFVVQDGACVKGKTRTEDMLPKPMTVTQEICVTKAGDMTEIKGWVFASNRITDLAFRGDLGATDRGALNYGQPVSLQTDGGYIRAVSGHYTLVAKRIASSL